MSEEIIKFTPKASKYPRAEWFEKKIALHLLQEKHKSGRHNGLIRASSVGIKCPRRLGYMVLGYQEGPATAHQQYVLGMGNAIHDMIQMWMSNMGIVKATPYLAKDNSVQWKGNAEGTIKDSSDGIIGHYDGLTEPLVQDPDIFCGIDKKTGLKYLLEFKTIANRSKTVAVFLKKTGTGKYAKLCTAKYVIEPGQSLFKGKLKKLVGSKLKPLDECGNEFYHQMVQEEDLPVDSLLDVVNQPGQFATLTKPKDEHILQSTYYAQKLGADKILVVYLAKDSGENEYSTESIMNIPIKAFEIDVLDENVKKVSNKAQDLWAHIDKRKSLTKDVDKWLPDRAFAPDDFMSECKFCPFTYVCYPANQTVKEQLEKRFKEHKALGLPVITGKPFTNHSENEFGLQSIDSVDDKSGQKATVH